MKKIKQLFITIFFVCFLSATFCETIEYHTTVENVESFITNLKGEGPFKVVVSGKMKSYTTYAIKTALNKNPTVNVELDLSNVKDMTYVDKLDFSYCTNLVAIILPDTIEYIGELAFSGCSNLKKITIPKKVTDISVQAFSKCTSLTSIVIPENVTRISSSAFGWCRQLETVYLPESLESIGINIFAGCTNLTNIIVDEKNDFFSSSDDKRILYNKDKTKIESFPSAKGKIEIPINVKEIALFAFSCCEELEEIYISKNVENIESGIFFRCKNLKKILVDENNQFYSSSENNEILYNKEKSILISFPSVSGKIELENGITIISEYAFSNSDLEEIIIPEGVKVIGVGAFDGCEKLEKIILPKSLEEIRHFAFSDCPNLTSINYKGTQEQWEKINKKFPIPTNINFVSDNVY